MFQSDFSGRVVNNDHFLYWGDIVKTNEEGIDFHVQVKSFSNFPIGFHYQQTVGASLATHSENGFTLKFHYV